MSESSAGANMVSCNASGWVRHFSQASAHISYVAAIFLIRWLEKSRAGSKSKMAAGSAKRAELFAPISCALPTCV